MPYALRFYLLLFVACVVVFIVGWLAPFGLGVNLLFAVSAAFLVIVIGGRLLGRKQL